VTEYPEYDCMTVDQLKAELDTVSARVVMLENVDRLGYDGRIALDAVAHRRNNLRARIEAAVWGKNTPDTLTLQTALERIARKADNMRMDAKSRRDQRTVENANEIYTLTQIGLRAIGAGHAL
jgi:hypothetical protein